MAVDFRAKFISDNIIYLNNIKDKLTDWEKDFLSSVEGLKNSGRELSRKQYNILRDICDKYKGK